ncbi:hypothetical protein KSC_037140 [Ktedonobacter sp. SOSP1-52]|uniref:WD40 repeat domain-containing serine/threonine protein kinase n=1 Tax=Ktedonobacter sp. SOSP1-52 TaxID=2778366 RepID=UPI001914E194|nr:WD40 repeat domain-containing serine/threonine protein kinase [Ktedonobacter sp. SOSP1-52]GHO64822.1 hypothetical protein KSC_037140 [Ktedonobacter sp. SOSP1-52]
MMNDGHNVQAPDISNTQQRQNIGRYRFLRLLGKGGMAEVWLCEDPSLHRQIAMKTLQIYTQGEEELLERFRQEAQAAAALNHPHVVPIHDYGQIALNADETLLFLVMPYLSGGSLADRIDAYQERKQLMPPREALYYLKQAAQAIDYAHAQGIVHRDIKPANMLLRGDSWLLLSDFGLARILASRKNLTRAGTSLGTPNYIAPEQIQGHAIPASDDYSLGVIAYQLFTGQLPFTSATPAMTTIMHLTEQPPAPRSLNPALPPQLEAILLRQLGKQPEERYSSAKAYIAALEEVVRLLPSEETQTTEATSTSTQHQSSSSQEASAQPAAQTTRPLSRRKLIIGAGTAVMALAAGTGGWLTLNHTIAPPAPQVHHTPTAIPTPDGLALAIPNQHHSPVASLSWSPTQNTFATVANDQQLLLWDSNTLLSHSSPQPLARTRLKLPGTTSAPLLSWSPDGKYIAVAFSGDQAASLALYTPDLKPLPEFAAPLTLPTSTIDGLTWLSNTHLLLAANDPDTQKQQFTSWLIDTTNPTQAPDTFALNYRLAVEASTSYKPVVLATAMSSQRAPRGEAILTFAVTQGTLVGRVQQQGKQLTWLGAPQSTTDTTQWNAGSTLFSFQNSQVTPSGSAFIAYNGKITGSYITQQNVSTLVLWDWTEKTSPFTQISTNTMLTNLAYKYQYQSGTFAGGTQDGHILVWNITQGTLPVGDFASDTLKHEVISLAWSSDGNWLVASYNDPNNSILLWKTQGRGF